MLPEQLARVKIDRQLKNVGWDIVSRGEYVPGSTCAVTEALMQGNTESDYLLFVDDKAIAVLEAKRGENPLGDDVRAQAEGYASHPQNWYGVWFPGQIPLPCLYVYIQSFSGTFFSSLICELPLKSQVKDLRPDRFRINQNLIPPSKAFSCVTAAAIPSDSSCIPTNWKWVRWGDLSESIQYGYNAPAKPDGRIKMLRISDIQGSIVDWGSVPYCDIEEQDISDYLLQENDILFARTGGTVGKSYLVGKLTEEVIFAGYLIRTRYSKRLSPKYLKYFMESTVYWKQLQAGTIATAQPNCNGKTLSKMLFPLPPMAEQLRIVDIIDSAFALLRKETMTYKNA